MQQVDWLENIIDVLSPAGDMLNGGFMRQRITHAGCYRIYAGTRFVIG